MKQKASNQENYILFFHSRHNLMT